MFLPFFACLSCGTTEKNESFLITCDSSVALFSVTKTSVADTTKHLD